MFSTSDREFHGRSHALEPHTTVPNRRLRAGDEEAENVADLDLGPVDVTEHKRDPSGPIVTSTTDTRLRDLTLLVDERSEVTSGSFVARACPDDCDASSGEEEDVLDQNAPVSARG